MKWINRRTVLIFSILVIILLLDQSSKIVVRQTLVSGQVFSYLGNTIVFEHSENRGAFLSLGSGLAPEIQFLFFTVFVSLFLVGILIYLIRNQSMDRLNTIALSLVTAGGIGNLIDRATRGSVTDFLNFGIGPVFRTGILNIADMAITFGVIAILLDSFKKQKN
jgi:signal peptidase II